MTGQIRERLLVAFQPGRGLRWSRPAPGDLRWRGPGQLGRGRLGRGVSLRFGPVAPCLESAGTVAGEALEKAEVRDYFNSSGLWKRWNQHLRRQRRVKKGAAGNIRIGHQKTVDQVLLWLQRRATGWAQLSSMPLWRRQPQPSPGPARWPAASPPATSAEAMGGTRRAAGAAADLAQSAIQSRRLRSRKPQRPLRHGDLAWMVSSTTPEPAEGRNGAPPGLDGERPLAGQLRPAYTPLTWPPDRSVSSSPAQQKTTRATLLREDAIVAQPATAGFQPLRRSPHTAVLLLAADRICRS